MNHYTSDSLFLEHGYSFVVNRSLYQTLYHRPSMKKREIVL